MKDTELKKVLDEVSRWSLDITAPNHQAHLIYQAHLAWVSQFGEVEIDNRMKITRAQANQGATPEPRVRLLNQMTGTGISLTVQDRDGRPHPAPVKPPEGWGENGFTYGYFAPLEKRFNPMVLTKVLEGNDAMVNYARVYHATPTEDARFFFPPRTNAKPEDWMSLEMPCFTTEDFIVGVTVIQRIKG